MMGMDKVDITIVGGGLAGLSTAVEICSKSDLNVILIEKKAIGSNQTTPAVFVEAINEFGLEDSILQNYTGFIQHSPLGAYASFDFGRVILAALDYQKACNILYQRAVSDGLMCINAKAIDWSPTVPNPDKPLVVSLDDDRRIQTEILIDASGHVQWAAKRLQIKRSIFYSHCFGELLTGCSIKDNSSFYFLGPSHRYGNGGGWFYPIGQEVASIGYSLVVPEAQRDKTELIAGYLAAKKEFQPYAALVKESSRKKAEFGIVPVGRIGRFFTDRVLIVGDAGGQAHPWVVEGCRPALYNGKLCAQVVLEAFAKKLFNRSFLSSYERKWNKTNRERFWRSASIADIIWNQTDENWNKMIDSINCLSPEQMIVVMRDNYATVFHKAYTVAGYIRRGLVKWLRG